jgi:hypothetical protein
VLVPVFTTTMSGLLSPLKSPTVIADGFLPDGKLTAGLRVSTITPIQPPVRNFSFGEITEGIGAVIAHS